MAGSAAGSTTVLGKVRMLCSVEPTSLMEMLTLVLVTRFAFLPVVASPARSLRTLGVPVEEALLRKAATEPGHLCRCCIFLFLQIGVFLDPDGCELVVWYVVT